MKKPSDTKTWLFSFVELAFLLLVMVMVAQRNSAGKLCTIELPLPKRGESDVVKTIATVTESFGNKQKFTIDVTENKDTPFFVSAAEKDKKKWTFKQLENNIGDLLPAQSDTVLFIIPQSNATVQNLLSVYQLVNIRCAKMGCKGKYVIIGQGDANNKGK